jgi:sulfite exporter TauE/SafE
MLAFTAGTAPALIAVGWAGAFAAKRFARATAAAAPVLMLVNAAILLWLAVRAL